MSRRARECRSEPRRGSGRAARGAVLVALLLVAAEPAGAGPATVEGSIEVSRAALRTEGPKHDLDVVVSLSPVAASESPPSDGRATMDQRGLVFIPHVLAVQKGATVTFLNNDNDQHNVYFLDDRTGETLDIGTWGPGVSVDHRFDEAGMGITLCKLHLEMAAYIVVLEHPWFTAGELEPETLSGAFELRDVPPGEYELVAWHKKLEQKGGAVRLTVAESGVNRAAVVLTPARYARGEP